MRENAVVAGETADMEWSTNQTYEEHREHVHF